MALRDMDQRGQFWGCPPHPACGSSVLNGLHQRFLAPECGNHTPVALCPLHGHEESAQPLFRSRPMDVEADGDLEGAVIRVEAGVDGLDHALGFFRERFRLNRLAFPIGLVRGHGLKNGAWGEETFLGRVPQILFRTLEHAPKPGFANGRHPDIQDALILGGSFHHRRDECVKGVARSIGTDAGQRQPFARTAPAHLEVGHQGVAIKR